MNKIVSVLGLLVALSLGAIAWIGFPGNSDVMAGQPALLQSGACPQAYAALDEGYGVTREVLRDCVVR